MLLPAPIIALPRYTSTLHCCTTIVKKEGFLVLYSGLGARLGRAVPGQGIIFASYEVFAKFVTGTFAGWPFSSPPKKEGR